VCGWASPALRDVQLCWSLQPISTRYHTFVNWPSPTRIGHQRGRDVFQLSTALSLSIFCLSCLLLASQACTSRCESCPPLLTGRVDASHTPSVCHPNGLFRGHGLRSYSVIEYTNHCYTASVPLAPDLTSLSPIPTNLYIPHLAFLCYFHLSRLALHTQLHVHDDLRSLKQPKECNLISKWPSRYIYSPPSTKWRDEGRTWTT